MDIQVSRGKRMFPGIGNNSYSKSNIEALLCSLSFILEKYNEHFSLLTVTQTNMDGLTLEEVLSGIRLKSNLIYGLKV